MATSHYTTSYWLVNYVTKQYVPLLNVTEDFFDDDWIRKTPFKDAPKVDLMVQKIDSHQKANDHLFYGYDSSPSGGIFGVYVDTDKVSKEDTDRFVEKLRRDRDVAMLFRYDLTLCEGFQPESEPEAAEDESVSPR